MGSKSGAREGVQEQVADWIWGLRGGRTQDDFGGPMLGNWETYKEAGL